MNSRVSTTSRGGRSELLGRVRWVIPLVMMLAVPPVVLASHRFSDVPDSHPFHNEIGNLAGAGVTIGCGGGNYCPSDPVARDQMAGFLNRGLGRATAATGTTTWPDASANYVATAAIVTGGATGSSGVGFVLVSGSLTAYTETAGTCPCEITIWVARPVAPPSQNSPSVTFDISGSLGPTGASHASATVSWVFPVTSAAEERFFLDADVVTTSGTDVTLDGALTLAYFPFGGGGAASLTPAP